MRLPELLSPAGNLEKLKIAFNYGADAVFVGGPVFGLRKYAENFSLTELTEGVAYAHARGKLVYVVLNGFAHQSDIPAIIPHLHELEAIGVDGFIISDMGVLQLAKTYTQVPLHVSTQASVTNKYGVQFWKEAGAKRVILAREVSLSECREMLEYVDIELEIFVHGAMCASYSGKCLISNYMSGRDSNRGGCIQSCRHEYQISDLSGQSLYSAYVMNAKDLNGIHLLPEMCESGIASLKIEGRMKSNLYVANATRSYRRALDQLGHSNAFLQRGYEDLERVSNRQFSVGGLQGVMGQDTINTTFGHYEQSIGYAGTVYAIDDSWIYVAVKSPFSVQDSVYVMPQTGEDDISLDVSGMERFSGERLSEVSPNMTVRFPVVSGVQVLDVIYKSLTPVSA